MQIGRALLEIVFRPFDGDEHGLLAARQQGQRALMRPGKGGIQFNAVEHAQAARGAGAHVDQPAARFDAGQGRRHGRADAGRGLAHGAHGRLLVVDQGRDQVGSGILVQGGVVERRGFGFEHRGGRER